jgi:hypothetical protein
MAIWHLKYPAESLLHPWGQIYYYCIHNPVSTYSCSVECSRCTKRFKSSKSMWCHMMKSHQLSITPLQFLDENDQPVTFAKPTLIVCLAAYFVQHVVINNCGMGQWSPTSCPTRYKYATHLRVSGNFIVHSI